jgi:ABC-type dipeptide/oligopeptide/nickel transport system ATPase component
LAAAPLDTIRGAVVSLIPQIGSSLNPVRTIGSQLAEVFQPTSVATQGDQARCLTRPASSYARPVAGSIRTSWAA